MEGKENSQTESEMMEIDPVPNQKEIQSDLNFAPSAPLISCEEFAEQLSTSVSVNQHSISEGIPAESASAETLFNTELAQKDKNGQNIKSLLTEVNSPQNQSSGMILNVKEFFSNPFTVFTRLQAQTTILICENVSLFPI